jgi:hypothetical protein
MEEEARGWRELPSGSFTVRILLPRIIRGFVSHALEKKEMCSKISQENQKKTLGIPTSR